MTCPSLGQSTCHSRHRATPGGSQEKGRGSQCSQVVRRPSSHGRKRRVAAGGAESGHERSIETEQLDDLLFEFDRSRIDMANRNLNDSLLPSSTQQAADLPPCHLKPTSDRFLGKHLLVVQVGDLGHQRFLIAGFGCKGRDAHDATGRKMTLDECSLRSARACIIRGTSVTGRSCVTMNCHVSCPDANR